MRAAVLHQVGAEQQVVAGAHRGVAARRGTWRRSAGTQVADGAAQEGDEPSSRRSGSGRGGGGSRRPPRAPQPRVLLDEPGRGLAQELVAHVEGHVARAVGPDARMASSSSRVLSHAPAPSSTSVSAPARPAISAACSVEEPPLGPGRVVLGQPGDLLEQPAAGLVVEPQRRDRLRRRGEAACGRRPPARAAAVRRSGTPRR